MADEDGPISKDVTWQENSNKYFKLQQLWVPEAWVITSESEWRDIHIQE